MLCPTIARAILRPADGGRVPVVASFGGRTTPALLVASGASVSGASFVLVAVAISSAVSPALAVAASAALAPLVCTACALLAVLAAASPSVDVLGAAFDGSCSSGSVRRQ